jgi:dTDP-4-dehydrorhamnose 3,5-epimerase
MKITPLALDGAYEVVPSPLSDHRGTFLEWLRTDHLATHLGFTPGWVQANLSTSRLGVIRGLHVTAVPPGQAKYVTCVRGSVFDVAVDARVGSPTFGQWTGTVLDDVTRNAVYLGEGLAHAICATSEDATITYLCSSAYDSSRERAITPLDPDLAIRWPVPDPVVSERDAAAPTLAQLRERGELPTYAAYRALRP